MFEITRKGMICSSTRYPDTWTLPSTVETMHALFQYLIRPSPQADYTCLPRSFPDFFPQ